MSRMIELSSRENDQFKWLKSLNSSKGIKTENACLVPGRKIIEDLMLKNSRHNLLAEVVLGDTEPMTLAPKIYRLKPELFREVNEVGSAGPLLVVQTNPLEKWTPSPNSSKSPSTSSGLAGDLAAEGLTIVLPLGDPNNLGAAIRSSLAFGAREIVLTEEAAHPYLPKSIKSSAGASLMTELSRGPALKSLLVELKNAGYKILGLDMNGTDLASFHWPRERTALVVGEEGMGLPHFADLQKLSIPISKIESLNAMAALSVALYDYHLKTK